MGSGSGLVIIDDDDVFCANLQKQFKTIRNPRLASKMALLAEGMEEKLTIVALCLGSSPGT